MEEFPIPPVLVKLLGDDKPVEEGIGLSESRVFRLLAKDGSFLFAKVSDCVEAGALDREARRLRWLESAGVAVPNVVLSCTWQGKAWLVTACVPGVDAAQSPEPVAMRVAVMAEALKELHALDAGTCPFDESLPVKIARAEGNVRRGRVRQDLFDVAHRDIDPADLVKRLQTLRPEGEDIVVTHGDACLPNLLLDDGSFTGFVDCGSVGRADRYQDLALASRSIGSNLGPEWVDPFFAAYGLTSIDDDRIHFYRLLDEFF
jgi:aminoglycoside 3'-phosphotransferase-2